MIIVHVYHSFYPIIGGLERVVQKLAETQSRLGHEVHVVTSYYGAYDRSKDEILNNIYIHRVKTLKFGFPDIMAPREFPDMILKRADIVHIHSQNTLFNVRMAEKAKHYGVKIATHFMAVDSLSRHPDLLKRVLGSVFQKLLTYKALNIADLRLVKSLRDQHILKRRYHVKALYVPDGIDEEYLNKPKKPNIFRDSFFIEKDEPIFLYIGRLHPAKGPQVLVKAASYLRMGLNKFKVVIVGPGPQNWLLRLAKKLKLQRHIVITGPISEQLKISAIDASTAVVIPSLYDYVEVFSLVASEAWARGKPVVASAIGELLYRVKHGVNGLLVPPNDPLILAKTLMDDRLYKLRPGKEFYTWSQIASILHSHYKKIVLE